MRGLLLPCYVIEVVVVAQQEAVYAAEDGGIYVRRYLRDSASSFHWLSSSTFSCSFGRLSRIGDISSHLHYMMLQSIQTIYDPGNMSVSTYHLLLS